MKIGIDIRVLVKDAQTGIEEYATSLLDKITASGGEDDFVLYYNAFSKKRAEFDWMKRGNVEIKESKIPNQILNYSFLAGFPKVDRSLGSPDVMFSPHFLSLALSDRCKRIVTFHDLSFALHPEFFPLRKKYWHFLSRVKQQALKADKIIAISQSTKNDLVDLYGVKEEKIRVIYSGVGPDFKPIAKDADYLRDVKDKYFLPDNFILYLGTVEPRKNILAIIEAFEIIKRGKISPDEDLKFVIAGSFGWMYQDVIRAVKDSSVSKDIIFLGFVDSCDRAGIYNLAKLFVFPSFFEGFGFPPLEAMACGVPVITSNCSSLPETAGRGALMIDPYRPEEIAVAMREILNDNRLRSLLIQRGFEQTNKFSWEKCAQETLEFIKE